MKTTSYVGSRFRGKILEGYRGGTHARCYQSFFDVSGKGGGGQVQGAC